MVVSVSLKLLKKSTQPSATFLNLGLYSAEVGYVDIFSPAPRKPAWLLASQAGRCCHGRGNLVQPS